MAEWPVARLLMSSSARVFDYDRAIFRSSELSPNGPTAGNIAVKPRLLEAVLIESPYIAVDHSWGGVLPVGFLASRSKVITGMVFVDATGPTYFKILQKGGKEPCMASANGDLGSFEARV